jgi:hypothetical protein
MVGGIWGWLVKPAPKELSGFLIVLGKFGLGAIDFWANCGFGRSNVCRWVGAGLFRLLVGFGDGW